ncbi:hypothetical protein HT031_003470 [Scenedesmus sp. PABB004]|nr:hypothetical protein HT031_003470 [Scenedesmus sp. PABB004]
MPVAALVCSASQTQLLQAPLDASATAGELRAWVAQAQGVAPPAVGEVSFRGEALPDGAALSSAGVGARRGAPSGVVPGDASRVFPNGWFDGPYARAYAKKLDITWPPLRQADYDVGHAWVAALLAALALAWLDSLVDFEKLGVPADAGAAGPGAGAGVGAAGADVPPGGAARFDLRPMHALLAELGDPHGALHAVHVAGTKGKGSVATLLSAVLRAAGYRVGTYTSPHIASIAERVVVGGGPTGAPAAPVSGARWEALALRARDAAARVAAAGGGAAPSHFEAVTAMALRHFADEGVELAVVEAGLGAARDATNVWAPPRLAAGVVTAIGLDHVAALGGSLASITAAKAGVMKPGAPCVVARQAGDGERVGGGGGGEVWRVLREAAAQPGMRVPLLPAADAVQVTPDGGGIDIAPGPGLHLAAQLLSVRAAAGPGGRPLQLDAVRVQLVGEHQAANVQAAVAAALVLEQRGWARITADAIRAGLEAAWLPGRFQVVRPPGSAATYVLDGAHTADSAAALAATLRAAFPAAPLVLVLAMAADKPHREVCEALRAARPSVAVFTSVPIAGSHHRAAPPGTLAAHWQAAAMLSPGRPFRCRELIQAGLGAALEKARHELRAQHGGAGVVLVTGSLHAVGGALALLEQGWQ